VASTTRHWRDSIERSIGPSRAGVSVLGLHDRGEPAERSGLLRLGQGLALSIYAAALGCLASLVAGDDWPAA
jgi:hypothetical protein